MWADGQAGAGAAEMATPFKIPGTLLPAVRAPPSVTLERDPIY